MELRFDHWEAEMGSCFGHWEAKVELDFGRLEASTAPLRESAGSSNGMFVEVSERKMSWTVFGQKEGSTMGMLTALKWQADRRLSPPVAFATELVLASSLQMYV